MKPVIEVKNLSKKYRIGVKQPYYSLRDTLMGYAKNPFTFLKRRRINNEGLAEDEFWALKDISFKVMPGEAIGIIGKNGAGKTTLLKLLSRITPPTEGEIVLRGRVASLLEVGTGFHSELTGRDNIYLNGAILGMKRVEIRKKFDEIVAFAEVEKFLDTPVKHYSSGMYMRLAFAVAAHLDCEILLVDEVLSVGDAAFQKKSLGKMENISKTGRTVLFVSHNLSMVKKLCHRGILIRNGKATKKMKVGKLINQYQYTKLEDAKRAVISLPFEGFKFNNFRINDHLIGENPEIFPNEEVSISFDYSSSGKSYDLCVSFAFRKKEDYTLLLYTHNHLENVRYKTKKKGAGVLIINLPHVAPGNYILEIQIWFDGRLVVNAYEIGDLRIKAIPAFSSNQTFSFYPSHLLLSSKWEFK